MRKINNYVRHCLIYLLLILLPIIFTSAVNAKDFELALNKNFLQALMDKVFPLHLSEAGVPGLKLSDTVPVGYKLEAFNPNLSIKKDFLQVDFEVSFSSILGKQQFPGRCKFAPVFNPNNNQIQFKVLEGTVDIKIEAYNGEVDLGTLDLTPYISSLSIPLEMSSIKVKDKTIKPKCQNTEFKLYADKITMSSDIKLN